MATIVVVLLTSGVLLGFAAITIDVGQLMLERRELQNGADAGALSLAQSCAEGNCVPNADGLETLVDGNASGFDGTHEVVEQCGTLPGLPPCTSPGSLESISSCPPAPGGDYVEVHTRTTSDASGSPLRNIFGAAAGGSGTSETGACARAILGPVGSTGTTLPLTISVCDWNAATSNGTVFGSRPSYSPAPAMAPTLPINNVPDALAPRIAKINAHENGNPATACGPSMYAPGGFGWLNDTEGSDDCAATFNADGTIAGLPGGAPPNGCKQDAMQKYLGTEVLIPVFTSVAGNGSGVDYTVAGISSFYFVGWDNMQTAQPNKNYSIYKTPTNNFCGQGANAKTCIWGWFTSPLVPVGDVSVGGPSRGTKTFGLGG
ncbi:Tad domain-containing protein [Phycicoccus sp. BSK3Z-2]|uniref:Tad domain-containing protein n=1 Tax=Phycicoccus avicenniae TaxID=2828860 RepID=A0A941DAM7_9MICO|nr:Tad domain-containing protein [Phycicoccus avicenniae]MBR7743910.1 Tad domain-containing protein [Phycicoccus avicenniae]